ncbi:MAG: translation initiation factor IF-2 [Candidatus Komeilibacteria bacterium]
MPTRLAFGVAEEDNLIMNVSELARQLNVTQKELLEKLPELGFSIGGRAIKVDDRQVDKIIAAWKKKAKLEAIKRAHEHVTEVRGKDADAGENKKVVAIGPTVIVKELADAMGLPLAKVMGEMMRNGIMASLNERLDFDTASIIAEDLGFKVEHRDSASIDEQSNKQRLETLLSARDQKATRPPVVVVMGHVDHGKTKLLDAIRKTNLMAGEAGGITQHIGAYQTVVKKGKEERLITFLDTPGHEAFKTMRSRGGQIADVAILVVAADDGLKPQTLESLAIIQKENLPFIVAINKIDKPQADVERVKKELAEINLIPEDWGGKIICVPISALKGEGLDDLLDMVLLVADINELKADESGAAVGTVIESHMDEHEGPVATALIQAGTLRVNDLVTVGTVPGKIKSMKSWKGESITSATPSTPVKILGLKAVPQSGDILHLADKEAYKLSLKNLPQERSVMKPQLSTAAGSEEGEAEIPTLNLVIKADVLGSLEAIDSSLTRLNSRASRLKIVKKGLGFISDGDIQAAETAHALLIAFHLRTDRQIEQKIADKRIDFVGYDIIYKLIEDIQARLKKLEQPNIVHTLVGSLKVLAIFKTKKRETILGGKVLDGIVVNPCKVTVLRNNNIITYGDLSDLEANHEKMREVAAGNECGLKFSGETVLQVGDILEFFTEANVTKN